MKSNSDGKTVSRLLGQAYLEVIPTGTILDRLVHIPRQCFVAITCSHKKGLEATLELVEKLRSLPDERRLKLVPHVAARMIRDKGHLREILARLEAAGVESIFVPGGDIARPLGQYDNSLQVLRDMADIGHGIEDVGIAAYPEGHPLVSEAQLMWFLKEKQAFATYLVTQMCFDPVTLVTWLKAIRGAGVHLPAWIGLPGVTDMGRLFTLSLQIGVGQSLNVLKKQRNLLRNIMTVQTYEPDGLLEVLGQHLGDPRLIVPGFHLFSFNDVERTEKWRVKTCDRLMGEYHA